jgi:putative ABC transport system permease protein
VRVSWPEFTALVPEAQPDKYLVKLAPGTPPKPVIAALNDRAGGILQASPLGWAGDADGFLAILNTLVGGLATAIVLLAAAGVFNVAFLAVMERRRDHAILKAVGMSARQFVAMVFSFGAFLTVCAALIGIPLGLWFEDFLLNSVMGSQWGFELPQGTLDPLTALAIVAGALAVALLGTAIPARRALTVPAAVVLHSE